MHFEQIIEDGSTYEQMAYPTSGAVLELGNGLFGCVNGYNKRLNNVGGVALDLILYSWTLT